MESQKIINLLDSSDNESEKFAAKTLLMIKALVIMLMVMVRMVLQLNLKLK